jgi:hypothetical protein
MPFDSTAGLGLAGAGFSMASSLMQGMQTKAAEDFKAAQYRQAAGQEQAASQRSAYEIDKQAQRIASQALANAAASGGGASDPTVLNIMAQNAQEMAYRRQLALYQGDEKARALGLKASVSDMQGKQAMQKAWMGALGAGIEGAASLKGKFGQGQPSVENPTGNYSDYGGLSQSGVMQTLAEEYGRY